MSTVELHVYWMQYTGICVKCLNEVRGQTTTSSGQQVNRDPQFGGIPTDATQLARWMLCQLSYEAAQLGV